MSKDSIKVGTELNQLSRFLFDEAADHWYRSLGLQAGAGLLSTFISFVTLSDDWKLFFAVIIAIISFISYYLRISFDEKYERAETMRRQAALSEGLGFPLCKTQLSEWMRRAGTKLTSRLDIEQRTDDYYATKDNIGPNKLLMMTIESAFYTRHLYAKIKDLVWIFLIFALILSFTVLTVISINIIPQSIILKAAYALYLLLPVLLSIDLILWGFRLERLVTGICEIEKDMEGLLEKSNIEEPQVIRLVSEYNCQVVGGIPIHNFLFNKWHDEIKRLWDKRNN